MLALSASLSYQLIPLSSMLFQGIAYLDATLIKPNSKPVQPFKTFFLRSEIYSIHKNLSF